ncbi:hypothetical protein K1719_019981 [Acacia pycnantha]|nr:hypothetical protein K1719_047006 [Acacia pycnantha]KAI9109026.1 hypothetical protein K1719_019981 [Acacia pycnantha]
MERDSDAVSRASLIISFCHMTSASHDEALFFLESHNFDLDAALSSFFNNSASPFRQRLTTWILRILLDQLPVELARFLI